MSLTDDVKAYLASIGTKGGKKKSKAKTEAARENAKLGGRPKHKKPSYMAQKKRESRARLAKKT